MEQLLLVTFCDSPVGIGASLRTDTRTHKRTDRRTHRREGENSDLDCALMLNEKEIFKNLA